jgi:hypothetical protein
VEKSRIAAVEAAAIRTPGRGNEDSFRWRNSVLFEWRGGSSLQVL